MVSPSNSRSCCALLMSSVFFASLSTSLLRLRVVRNTDTSVDSMSSHSTSSCRERLSWEEPWQLETSCDPLVPDGSKKLASSPTLSLSASRIAQSSVIELDLERSKSERIAKKSAGSIGGQYCFYYRSPLADAKDALRSQSPPNEEFPHPFSLLRVVIIMASRFAGGWYRIDKDDLCTRFITNLSGLDQA